jgi:hypothetical protein
LVALTAAAGVAVHRQAPAALPATLSAARALAVHHIPSFRATPPTSLLACLPAPPLVFPVAGAGLAAGGPLPDSLGGRQHAQAHVSTGAAGGLAGRRDLSSSLHGKPAAC